MAGLTRFPRGLSNPAPARKESPMTAELPRYEILAVRYGTSSARPASQNFIMSDGHDGPMPMDFYIWVIRGEGRTIVVDTGFSAGASERRNRRFVHAPVEALAQAGVDPAH